MIILRKSPPLLAFIYLVLAFQVHIRLPEPVIVPDPLNLYLFLILTAAGLGIMLVAVKLFEGHRTTHKFEEVPTEISTPTTLVMDGVYRFSRNPMYVGMVSILAGIASWFATPWVFLAPLAFFLTVQLFFVPREERLLAALFGSDYESYKSRVRRWF